MSNLTGNYNFEGKVTNPRATTALTPAATVNVDFSAPKSNTLAITAPTVINIAGTYANDDMVFVKVTATLGATLQFLQGGFVFKGGFVDASGFLTNLSATTNYIRIVCLDSTSKEFQVVNTPTLV